MPQALLLPSATSDLAELWDYIAYDNPANADRFVDRIRSTCSTTLAENPRIGRSREELSPELRSFPFQDYLIFYRPIDDGVEIVRVLHGSRDIESLLDP